MTDIFKEERAHAKLSIGLINDTALARRLYLHYKSCGLDDIAEVFATVVEELEQETSRRENSSNKS